MKFKSNAAYKKWLAKYKKGGLKKYQAGGGKYQGGDMYGANVIPNAYTPSNASINYLQTDPAVTSSLLQQQEELGTEVDLSEVEAKAAKRKQTTESVMPTLESIAKSADKAGLLGTAAGSAPDLTGTIAEKMSYNAPIPGVDQGLGAASQTAAQAGTLKAGVQAYKGAKAAGATGKAALQAGSTAAGWAGPQAVGTAAAAIGKGIEKASDDDDATTMNVGETSGKLLKGAGYGAAAAGLAGSLGAFAGANIWNPVGWAAGIGALGAGAVGLLQRRAGRKDEGEATSKFNRKQDRIAKKLAKEEEKQLTYSGYDFGEGPSIMGSEGYQRKTGGARQYQEGGNPLMDYINSKQSEMTPEQIAQIQNTGTITEDKGLWNEDEGVVWNARNLLDKGITNLQHATLRPGGYRSKKGDPTKVQKNVVTTGLSEMFALPSINRLVKHDGDLEHIAHDPTDKSAWGHAALNVIGSIPGSSLARPFISKTGKIISKTGDEIVAQVPGVSKYLNKGDKLQDLYNYGSNIADRISTPLKSIVPPSLLAAVEVAAPQVGNILRGGKQLAHHGHQAAEISDAAGVHATGGRRVPGGKVVPIPGSDAVEFKGQTHAEGGIRPYKDVEVENDETMDQVTMKDQGKQDYFFSSYLKRGGKSYADIHKSILKSGGSQKAIDILAKMQEKDANRNPEAIQVAAAGGPRKYQTGGLETADDEYNTLGLENYENTTGPDLSLFEKMQQKYQDYKAGAPQRQLNRAVKGLNRDVPIASQIAAAGQMIPAAYALMHKEKPVEQVEGAERIIAPDLNRVNFNTDRAKADSDYRALTKSIETSGSGPASVIAKMASYDKKQDANQKITTAETRTNQEIENREAALQQQATTQNIANAMRVDTMNTQLREAQRVAEENTKKEALDVGFKNIAGISSDVLAYQAAEREARAVGAYGIYERDKLRSALKGKTNPNTNEVYTDAEIAQLVQMLADKKEQ